MSTLSTDTKPQKKVLPIKGISLLLAFLALLGILMLPTPEGLPVAGHRTLAILAFAVVLWVSEAVSYPVSAVLITVLTTLLLGFGPSLEDPEKLMGTKDALTLVLSGFSNSAVILVAGALFLAAAMQSTKLDRRIALTILSKVGSRTKSILMGAILVGVALSFFVPSTTARVGAIVPIILGMVAAFGLQKDSRLAALLMIASAQAASIWNIGIKTAAAQNMVALGFMEKAFGVHITWGQWFLYAAPWSIIMSIVLYYVMLKVIPPEIESIPNGGTMVKKQLKDLGPLTQPELRLMIISITLLFLWSTEGIVHSMDTTTSTLLAVAVMLTPKIGVFSWKEAEGDIPWGTIILFAVGISLGSVLLKTKAADWMASTMFDGIGLATMSIVGIIAVLSIFNILIHLGFASATSLAAAFIPIVIALSQGLGEHTETAIGIVLIQQFVVSFGFLLPVNAPQNMLAYGTGAFTVKDFLKAGIPLTIIGYLLILLFSATYWQWIGLL
ncbi:DASS family sodium-coupled anion symporter [Ammoniphilus sp. CFH 90114]|uniref:SLC13 family permease n=1 Tax=Ammoniphilus sp. CFH 90114 TaxID=2493665 RepID=UPI00100F8AD4|nr:DASS family sodium-coupled anion symporter [Ammoniphilus sp. CFH 90114]RXT01545.1 DASS family sodium-coupled anion symporter [Ammoniphilus sp. CFH 90114]